MSATNPNTEARLLRMEKELLEVRQMMATMLNDQNKFGNLRQPLQAGGEIGHLGQVLESLMNAAAAADREAMLGVAVGLAKGIDRLGQTGVLNLVYGENNGQINAGYDHLPPP